MIVKKSMTLPPGVYDAALVGIQEDSSQYGPVLKWDWRTNEGAIVSITSTRLGEKSKFGQTVRALLGHIPDEVDTSRLLGLSCRIVVKEDGEFTKVTEWLPKTGAKSVSSTQDPFEDQ